MFSIQGRGLLELQTLDNKTNSLYSSTFLDRRDPLRCFHTWEDYQRSNIMLSESTFQTNLKTIKSFSIIVAVSSLYIYFFPPQNFCLLPTKLFDFYLFAPRFFPTPTSIPKPRHPPSHLSLFSHLSASLRSPLKAILLLLSP